MATKIINVRGQFGVQVLQAAVGLSTLHEDDKPLIVVNNAGNVIPPPVKRLEFGSRSPIQLKNGVEHVENTLGSEKTPYWVPGAATAIFNLNGIDNIRKYMGSNPELLKQTPYPPDMEYVAVHIRGHDKKMASEDTYVRWVEHLHNKHSGRKMLLVGDDKIFIQAIFNQLHQNGNVHMSMATEWEDEYAHIFNAKWIYSAPSAFILSMLLINPRKHINILGRQYCDGPYANQNDYVFIDEAMAYSQSRYCENLGYLDFG